MGISYNTSTVRDGLVLHLDVANKKSYAGTGTTWKDLSGNGNNGTLVNGVAYSADNKGTMTFDGVNDYVSLGKQVYNNTDDFTISTFVKSNSTQNTYSVPISQGHFPINGLNAGFAFQVGWPSASDMSFVLGDGSWRTLSFSYTPRTDLSWNHLTVTKIGNLFTTFKNNIQISSLSSTIIYGSFDFTIGMDTFNTGRNWNGNISNVQLYNRALSAAEIKQNFEALRGRYGI